MSYVSHYNTPSDQPCMSEPHPYLPVNPCGSPFDCCQPGSNRYEQLTQEVWMVYIKILCDKLDSIDKKLDKLTQK